MSLCTVWSIRKFWLSENYHLSLTPFFKMRLKLLTISKYMASICVCSINSVKRWEQNINTFFCTQKFDGFLEANHWVFELWESLLKFLVEKEATLIRSQNLLSCVSFLTYSTNSISHFKEKWQLFSSCQIRLLYSKLNWNYGDGERMLGLLTCFTY